MVSKGLAARARLPKPGPSDGSLELAEFAFVTGEIAGGEEPRLGGPVVAPDASLEPAELRIDAVDLGVVPGGDLGERGHAERVKRLGQLGTEALDAGQVVALLGG